MGKLGKIAKKIVINITPPVIISAIRKVETAFCVNRRELPQPSEYSTLDGHIEVPCQVESYLLCRNKYLRQTDIVLDVGFGLGYGLHIMTAKAEKLLGVEVDARAVAQAQRLFEGHPKVKGILAYDGVHLPFKDKSVDVVTCIEVLEHVENYEELLLEMARVSKRLIFITTPNCRPENTLPDGSPKNYWHRREWTRDELEVILAKLEFRYEWNFLNGPYDGPFTVTAMPTENTWSLIPVILLDLK